jgi:uncharacterized membrane protein
MHCTHCGARLTDNRGYCQNCGRTAGTIGAGIVGQPTASGAAVAPNAQTSVAVSLQPNVAGLLCYALGFVSGIFFLIVDPYKQNQFVRFHALQSIFLSVAWTALYLVFDAGFAILPGALWSVSLMLNSVLSLAVFLLWLFLMYKAYNNERFKLPVIGDVAERQA